MEETPEEEFLSFRFCPVFLVSSFTGKIYQNADLGRFGRCRPVLRVDYASIARRPPREESLTIAPAAVETKARYELDWFESALSALHLRPF